MSLPVAWNGAILRRLLCRITLTNLTIDLQQQDLWHAWSLWFRNCSSEPWETSEIEVSKSDWEDDWLLEVQTLLAAHALVSQYRHLSQIFPTRRCLRQQLFLLRCSKSKSIQKLSELNFSGSHALLVASFVPPSFFLVVASQFPNSAASGTWKQMPTCNLYKWSQWAAQLPRLGTLFLALCLLPLANIGYTWLHKVTLVTSLFRWELAGSCDLNWMH